MYRFTISVNFMADTPEQSKINKNFEKQIEAILKVNHISDYGKWIKKQINPKESTGLFKSEFRQTQYVGVSLTNPLEALEELSKIDESNNIDITAEVSRPGMDEYFFSEGKPNYNEDIEVSGRDEYKNR